MDTNATDFMDNVTLDQVIDYFNLNLSTVNQSEVTQIHLFDLYEAYRSIEKDQLMVYKSVAYVLGTLIILSNLTVVISSGLILRKGQQPKSTYLLLGNVSLADTIIGFSIIFGVTVDNSVSSNPLCIFQIGMVVCPAMVSIFSVGLIAVDRYIYILHGLYYQRWFNTTRVRIGILFIWIIGIILGFMPATGWTNKELMFTRCYYVSLFPGTLILLNSLLSIIPIVVVSVLYFIILIKALKTVKSLKSAASVLKNNENFREDKPKLRIYRGSHYQNRISTSLKLPSKNEKLFRTVSLNNCSSDDNLQSIKSTMSNSADDITYAKKNANKPKRNNNNQNQTACGSVASVFTVDTVISERNAPTRNQQNVGPRLQRWQNQSVSRRLREPNKWRAITIVMLTSGSFIFTWVPFFIVVIFFVFCEEQLTNPQCLYYRHLVGGPVATLAFVNSILNPLIYAWWHKGFQRTAGIFYVKYFKKHFCCYFHKVPT